MLYEIYTLTLSINKFVKVMIIKYLVKYFQIIISFFKVFVDTKKSNGSYNLKILIDYQLFTI